MKQFFINNNSDTLLLFFAGWGCDENEFAHLKSESDVLILYDYTDLAFDFDFSEYKEINLLAFSAGVFISSVLDFDFKFNKKLALGGNPYLFDEYFGLSENILKIFKELTKYNITDFVKNYIVKTHEELKIFNGGKRTIESCMSELDLLKKIYDSEKSNIKPVFEKVIFGAEDKIFNLDAQKEFYGNALKIVPDARHNLFFRVKSFEELFCIF